MGKKEKGIIVITGISDNSLAVRRKVKQRSVMDVLNTSETYSFIRTEVRKFLEKSIKYRSQKEFGNYSERNCSKRFYYF